MLYHEVAIGAPSNRGFTVPVDDLRSIAREHLGKALYYSVYAFDETGKEKVDARGALVSELGLPLYVRWIWLDVDGPKLSDAVHKTIETLRILKVYEVRPVVWYSGRKGFHLQVGNLFGLEPSPDVPSLVTKGVRELLGDLVDVSPLRSAAGLIRLPFSRHECTGHWKMPVYALREFRPEDYTQLKWQGVSAPETPVIKLDELTMLTSTPLRISSNGGDVTIHGALPGGVPYLCAWEALRRGPIRGTRHATMLRMVSGWKRLGVPLEYARVLAAAWLDEEWGDEWERLVQHVYKRSYHYGCRDEIMARHCKPQCSLYRMRSAKLVSAEDMLKKVGEYSQLKQKAFDIGAPIGDSYEVLPGSLVILTGDTGVGKSAFAQTLAVKLGRLTLYLNTEVGELVMARRFAQIAYQISAEEVEYRAAQLDASRLAHINMLTAHPSAADLEKLALRKPYEIIVVDTTDNVDVPGVRSEVERLKVVIETLRRLANRMNALVIGVHHINKMGAMSGNLTLNALSGKRDVVTKADYVLAVVGQKHAPQRYIKTLKSRDAAPRTLKAIFNFQTFTFTQPLHESNPI